MKSANEEMPYPADLDLEYSLIGAFLVEPPLLDALNFVESDDFHDSILRKTYQRMRKLWDSGQEITPELVADRDREIASSCFEAQSRFASALAARDVANKLRDLTEKRKLIPALQDWAEKVYNGVPAESILDTIEADIQSRRGRSGGRNFFERWNAQGLTAAAAAQTEITERKYIVEDVIREKSVTIFYGAPGDLKSALLMDMVMNIGNGTPWLNPLPVEGNKQRPFATIQGRVLWLNYDQSHDDVVERFGAMARSYGGGENVTAISHSTPPAVLEKESQARALGEFCKSQGYSVIVVDSLLDVKGKADLQESVMGDVLRMWRLVSETGECSVIIIAHSTKATGDLYGSQFIKAKLDHLYQVARPSGTDTVIVESKKQRSFGEDGKIRGRWTYQHFAGTRTLQGARFWGDSTEERAEKSNSVSAQIKRVLMESPGRGFTVAEVAEILNGDRDESEAIKDNSIRNALNRLATDEPNFHKQEDDGLNFYHYGELTHTAKGG